MNTKFKIWSNDALTWTKGQRNPKVFFLFFRENWSTIRIFQYSK